MSTAPDNLLDDVFLGCALTAFLQVAREQQAMPDEEATRRLAFDLYEQVLKEKNGAVRPTRAGP